MGLSLSLGGRLKGLKMRKRDIHPDRPAKIVCPDGRMEEIASKTGA
jgi:hypothetical protein